MQIRKTLNYPPYFYICYIRISGKDMNYVSKESIKIKNALNRNLTTTKVLGPTPANIFKLNNIYRYGIILKYKKDNNLYNILEKILDYYKSDSRIRIDIDFNPSHF